MKRILVAYATHAGSTAEVAQVVADELGKAGFAVAVLPVGEVQAVDGYDGVVAGGPMILGWHRAASGFLRKHRLALEQVPLAAFVMAMSLTETGQREFGGVPVHLDDRLARPPVRPGRLSLKERYASLDNYLRPVLAASGGHKPVSIGVFAGRLEYGRLSPWAVVLVMLILKVTPGDRRDWATIRSWAAGLPRAFGLKPG